MFSESSPCLLGQHGSCSIGPTACGTFKKHFTKPFSQTDAPDCSSLSWVPLSKVFRGHLFDWLKSAHWFDRTSEAFSWWEGFSLWRSRRMRRGSGWGWGTCRSIPQCRQSESFRRRWSTAPSTHNFLKMDLFIQYKSDIVKIICCHNQILSQSYIVTIRYCHKLLIVTPLTYKFDPNAL